MARSDRIPLNSYIAPFSPPCAHLAPHVGHLARLVGHLGANMSHKCSQDARKMPSWSQHRQTNASATFSSTPKYQKTYVFRRFLLVFCHPAHVPKYSQNAPNMLPKPPKLSPRSPTWRYHGPSWSQLAANLAPTSPLRPSSRQPAQKLSENRAQHAKRCPKISQDCSKTRFSSHRPPPGTPKYQQKCVFLKFL